MRIKYLIVRPSGASPKMSRFDATTITAVIHRTSTLNQLNLTLKDQLSICFEQALLSDYLLEANPNNKEVKAYRDACAYTAEKLFKQRTITTAQLEAEQILPTEFKLLVDFAMGTGTIAGTELESILRQYSGAANCAYTTVPENFAYPYLQFKHGFIMDKGPDAQVGTYSNPVVLSPNVRFDKESGDQEITFYCRPHTSMTVKVPPLTKRDTLSYICAMNYNGKSWKELIDTIQSVGILSGVSTGSESLSVLLNGYLRNKAVSTFTDLKPHAARLMAAFKQVFLRDDLVVVKSPAEISEFCSLFEYFGDSRLGYLRLTDPRVGQEQLWSRFNDLSFLAPLSLVGYVMAADDSKESGSTEDSEAGDTEDTSDESQSDDTENTESGEEDEDLFADDEFAEDDDTDDSGDESGSSDSTDTSSESEPEVKPEDVNPLIDIIDDETFDEYLDRGILQRRIKRLIVNPPDSISGKDVQFLKYWYLQWFPCVSVATTKTILGDILKLKSKPLR